MQPRDPCLPAICFWPCRTFAAAAAKSLQSFPTLCNPIDGRSEEWEIDGDTVETVSDFIFGGSKITADGDCSHKIKRRLLLGRKVVTNLDSILKSSP